MAFSFFKPSAHLFSLRIVFGLVCAIPLTSCFELHETVQIIRDGSGSFQLELDASEHERMLTDLARHAALSGSKTFGEGDLPFEELIQAWVAGASQLNEIKGISNAQPIVNREQFIFGWSFDFESIDDLNLALSLKEGLEYNPKYKPTYRFERRTLYKTQRFPFHRLLDWLQRTSPKSERPRGVENQKKAIFAGVRYRCTIQVEKKVKRCSNGEFVLSEDNRTLTYQTALSDIKAGTADISSKIKFK